jgi:hypothetical protein
MVSRDVRTRFGVIALAFILGNGLVANEVNIVCEGDNCKAVLINKSNSIKNNNKETHKFKVASATNVIDKSQLISLDDNEVSQETKERDISNSSSGVIVTQIEEIQTEYDTKYEYEYEKYESEFSNIKKSFKEQNSKREIYACTENKTLVCDTIDKTCECV